MRRGPVRKAQPSPPGSWRNKACLTASSPSDPLDQIVLDVLTGPNGKSTQEVAAAIARTPRATRTRLMKLVGHGLVLEIGSSPQDPKRRYVRVGAA